MRLKTFTASTMKEAMDLVKDHMGANAIIVSTQDIPGTGVRLTAAVDRDPDFEIEPLIKESPQDKQELIEQVEHALINHNMPERLIIRLNNIMGRTNRAGDVQQLLATALEDIFEFSPLPERKTPRAMVFVGPPGSGKTIATAKAVARAVINHRKVAVISTDYKRAGAGSQLAAFTDILKVKLRLAKSPSDFKIQFSEVREADIIVVDTASCNPYQADDIAILNEFISSVPCEPILVLPAGIDPYECADICNTFANSGAVRMIISRLDVAARLGGALYGADSGNLSLCNVSMSPQVADGLPVLSPVALAKLLIPSDRGVAAKPRFSEVMR